MNLAPGAPEPPRFWYSSDAHTDGLVSLTLLGPLSDPSVRLVGALSEGAEDEDWGEAPAELVLGPDGQIQVLLADLDEGRTRLQAGTKLGVMVVGLYRTFQDGRFPRFDRPFLSTIPRRREDARPTWSPPAPVDPRAVLGAWVNTSPEPRVLRGVEIHLQGEGASLTLLPASARHASAHGLGEQPLVVSASLYATMEEDDQPSPALLVRHPLGARVLEGQLRVNKGVLVVAYFTQGAGGLPAILGREFFVQERAR